MGKRLSVAEKPSVGKDKKKEYQKLIEDVRSSYKSDPPDFNSKGVCLQWCDDCKEINLWTYWQGQGNLNPKILLVGQDWGCPTDEQGRKLIENIRVMKAGKDVCYAGIDLSRTDSNLKDLFETIDYQDIIHKQYSDLFFTNLALGYRSKGTSGNLKKSWLKHDYDFFRRLVGILEPETIICLGRATLLGVLQALQIKDRPRIKSYNAFIESEDNPVLYRHNEKQIRIFGFAHCGAMGTLNRNSRKGTDLLKQKEDWKKILR